MDGENNGGTQGGEEKVSRGDKPTCWKTQKGRDLYVDHEKLKHKVAGLEKYISRCEWDLLSYGIESQKKSSYF